MNKPKFTKGEWEIGEAYDCIGMLHEYPAIWCGDFGIAQICDMDEAKANAHLIKTAPKMYHLLKHVNNSIRRMPFCESYLYDICEDIEKLLAEARGEL